MSGFWIFIGAIGIAAAVYYGISKLVKYAKELNANARNAELFVREKLGPKDYLEYVDIGYGYETDAKNNKKEDKRK